MGERTVVLCLCVFLCVLVWPSFIACHQAPVHIYVLVQMMSEGCPARRVGTWSSGTEAVTPSGRRRQTWMLGTLRTRRSQLIDPSSLATWATACAARTELWTPIGETDQVSCKRCMRVAQHGE
jgi:hypothetical protein